MDSLEGIRGRVEKAIGEFNKYRSPEATATLVSSAQGKLEINFSGSFCWTCGYYDYFEDFRLLLEEFGIRAKEGKVSETSGGAVVEFAVM